MIKIVEYKNDSLTGKACFVEENFIPSMNLICGYAKDCGIKLHINSSNRDDLNVKGAIVTPAKKGNHLVGHAIDCNLIDGKVFWSSTMLEGKLTGNVLKFITLIQNSKLVRWGGDYKKRDVIHFDDGLNVMAPKKWLELYNLKFNK
jgi:hypothetical protein